MAEGSRSHEREVAGSRATLEQDPFAELGLHDDALAPGASIGRYVILERVGAGAMGVVYAAYDPELDRRIAIKLLRGADDPEAGSLGSARLLREAQALAKLAHPNVVVVHDVGTYAGCVFLAMEYIEGRSLTQWLREAPRTLAEILAIYCEAGRGLAAAHASGITHRDFKPDNVRVGEDGRARVLDFGLARRTGTAVPSPVPMSNSGPIAVSSRVDVRLTQTGAVAGTPAYMAPEQHRGEAGDARSDQFAFCVALWEAIWGERPFAGNDRASLAFAVCSGTRRNVHGGVRVPTRVRKALERGLAVDPEARHADLHALMDDLQLGPPRRRTAWLGAIAVASLGVLIWTRMDGTDVCRDSKADVDRVWSREHRRAIAERFADVGGRGADHALGRVKAGLDGHARAWADARREACAAALERHEQSSDLFDRRMLCLQNRLDAIAGAVTALQTIDASGLPRAVDVVSSLPPVTGCDDAETLLATVAPPPPAIRDEVATLRQRLAETRATGVLGRYADGLVAIEPLRARADALDYGPLVAEVEVLRGDLALAAGDPQLARSSLFDGTVRATASGHDEVAAHGMIRLVHTVGIAMSRYDEALDWGRQAAALVGRVGRRGALDAALAQTMCRLFADRSDAVAALPHCVRAVELATEVFGADSLQVAHAREALAISRFYAGDYAEAEAQFERVEVDFRRIKGPNHPDLANVANSLAAICFSARGAAECLPRFEHALAQIERSAGADSIDTADVRNNLAQAQVAAGRLEAAQDNAERALATRRGRFGDDHPGVAASLTILAEVARARGDLAAADERARAALEIFRRTRGEPHRDVVHALALSASLRAQTDRAGALSLYDDALAQASALHRPDAELDELRASRAALAGR